MYNFASYGAGSFFSFGNPFFILLMAWSLYWKGRSLWIAAKKDAQYWFIALLVINTMGILEILYIYYFSKKESCCGGKKTCVGSECDKKEIVSEKKESEPEKKV